MDAGAARPRRVLLLSSLYPSSVRPRHGIFVETRLRHLVRDCPVDARVVAPVPWFPFSHPRFGHYAAFAATPRQELRHGLVVSHPRYPMLPRIGVRWQPEALAWAARRALRQLRREGWEPELIDAHYFYPDGVAAALLGRQLGLPVLITARGTDVNVIAHLSGPGERIRWAADRAAQVIAVSTRLRDALAALGVAPAKLHVLRNGVDLGVFSPCDRAAARARFGLPAGPLAACVGNLVPEKGHELALDAVRRVAGLGLVVVGSGPLRRALAARAAELGLESRVRFIDNLAQPDLAQLYSAADVLLLSSTREGWPNVVLEALACGTPVAAVDVGAVGEMLTDPAVGRIVPDRDPAAYAAAIADLLRMPPDRVQLHRHAAGFDWSTVSMAQWRLFERSLDAAGPPDAGDAAPAT